MKYGICSLSLIPVRSQPGDRHEMINQLLFGDLVFIKDAMGGWLLIESGGDNYEGWIDEKQILFINEKLFNDLLTETPVYTLNACCDAVPENNAPPLFLTRGSRLPRFNQGKMELDGQRFTCSGKTTVPPEKPLPEQITEIAKLYLGTPYLWGGRSPFGIDCSGFTQIVFKLCGLQLQRDTSLQVTQGETLNLIHEALPADLAFFENSEGNINHVGILLSNSEIIHASGEVRIDKVDHQGIYNESKNKYTHQLRTIKRLL